MKDLLDLKMTTRSPFVSEGHPLRKFMDSDFSMFDDYLGGFNSFMENSFPPYNTTAISKNEYNIEVALAGYSKDDIEITLVNDFLNIISKKKVNTKDSSIMADYPYSIHRGISEKKINLKFKLPKNSEVSKPIFNNGLLTINVKKLLSEEEKIKVIEIE